MKKKIILLAGAPGSGKSYMGKNLLPILEESVRQINYFYPGAVIRDEIARETELGKECKQLLAAGDCVPGSTAVKLLQRELCKEFDLMIIDGCPRSLEQLNAMWHQLRQHQVLILFRNTPREIILEQIKNRLMCSSCQEIIYFPNTEVCPHCGGNLVPRPDDAIIGKRLNQFEHENLPAIERLRKFYGSAFLEMDGRISVEDQLPELKKIMQNFILR